MNGDAARVHDWARAINEALGDVASQVRVVFCPPAIYLAEARQSLAHPAPLMLGAQSCHAAEKGAYTGEVSASMLADMVVSHVLVGHSERRATGESDADVLERAKAVLAVGLTPVICVGEPLAAYEKSETNAVLDRQLSGLKALPTGAYLIAYEPIWAIGSNKTPTMDEINAAHRHIKSVLGSETSVLYGGSVSAANAREILAQPQVAGALIGGASLDIESMRTIIACAATRGK